MVNISFNLQNILCFRIYTPNLLSTVPTYTFGGDQSTFGGGLPGVPSSTPGIF